MHIVGRRPRPKAKLSTSDRLGGTVETKKPPPKGRQEVDMTDNQKFTLLVFALVMLAVVVGAWYLVQSQF